MSFRSSFLGVMLLLFSCGGGAFGAPATVRMRHSMATGCPDGDVTVAEIPGGPDDTVRSRYRAVGCGARATYACRPRAAGSEEWDCRKEEEQDPGTIFGTTEGGDSTGSSTMADGGVADAGARTDAGAHAGTDGGVAASSGADAGVAADPSAAVRAAIDAHAVDVLGCTGRASIGVHAVWDATGNVTFGLPGDLAGRPEEGCVRTAIGPLHVTGPAGELMDLVRH